MSRLFYHVMQDNAGNLLFDVSGTMRLAGTGTLATIYGDEALTVILPNPMTNHPSFGSFKCFLGAGDYDFYMAKSGYTFETLTGVQGHGTMAQQDASAVAITGGSAQGLTQCESDTFYVLEQPAGATIAFNSQLSAGTDRWAFYSGGTAPSWLAAPLGIQGAPVTYAPLTLRYVKATQNGLILWPTDSDASQSAIQFLALAGGTVGNIVTTATTTTYNTSSDIRLKHAIAPLTGALDVVQALRPITHLWRADDSRGVGFIAHEVAEVVDGVVTGERDAVDDKGRILPQQIDHSKLVPYLTAALKEALAMIDTLSARVGSLETQLGV